MVESTDSHFKHLAWKKTAINDGSIGDVCPANWNEGDDDAMAPTAEGVASILLSTIRNCLPSKLSHSLVIPGQVWNGGIVWI